MMRRTINAPLTEWRARMPAGVRRFLGVLWPGPLVVCVIAWLLLVAIVTGLAHDAHRRAEMATQESQA